MAPADSVLAACSAVAFCSRFLSSSSYKRALRRLKGNVLVLVLGALLLGEDHDTRRLVDEADGAFRPVHVLAASAARTGEANVDIGRVDLDVDAVVDHGIDGDGGEARVAARVRVIGRNAHEAMDAALRLQPAVGVLAFDLEGGRLDALLLRRGFHR